MTAAEIVAKVLSYREGNFQYAIFDLQAALDGSPGAVVRFGNTDETREALRVLQAQQRWDQDVLGVSRLKELGGLLG